MEVTLQALLRDGYRAPISALLTAKREHFALAMERVRARVESAQRLRALRNRDPRRP